MPDTKQLLERAAERVPAPRFDERDVRERHDRNRRSRRIRAGVVALALTVVAGIAAVSIVGDRSSSSLASGDAIGTGALPAASEAPLVAGDGEYYVRHVLLVAPCGDACTDNDVALDATYRWSPSDDSGRIDVASRIAYGIQGGSFGPGEFPNWNGIDVSRFPTDPRELLAFLSERSASDGASPAPVISPAPGAPSASGTLWRAITDLLTDPHTTPAVQAALLEATATLPGADVTLDSSDPFGRPAHVIEFPSEGGTFDERLYVDVASHDLLAITTSLRGRCTSDGAQIPLSPCADAPVRYFVVQSEGVVGSLDADLDPDSSAIAPADVTVDDLRALPGDENADAPTAAPSSTSSVPERCSQGGPDLELTRSSGHHYDHDCFVVEAGAPFTITFTVEEPGASGRLRIFARGETDALLEGDAVTGPGTIVYDVPTLGSGTGSSSEYLVLDGEVWVATLYTR